MIQCYIGGACRIVAQEGLRNMQRIEHGSRHGSWYGRMHVDPSIGQDLHSVWHLICRLTFDVCWDCDGYPAHPRTPILYRAMIEP